MGVYICMCVYTRVSVCRKSIFEIGWWVRCRLGFVGVIDFGVKDVPLD